MKWVYTDKAEIPHDEGFLIELVKAAKKYRLKELKERYCIWRNKYHYCSSNDHCTPGGEGGRGTHLYRLHRYVRRQRVWFFQPFWSKLGYQFWPFWSEIGYGLC